jgi:hypothetical protein
MKRNMRSLFSVMAIALPLVIAIAGCTDKSIQGQGMPDNGVVLRTTFTTPALLGSVTFVRLTVSGSEIATKVLDSRYPDSNAARGGTLDFDGSAIYAALDIDCGVDRVFVIEAVYVSPVGAAATEVVIYRGEQTVSVFPNRQTAVNLVMEPAVPLVRFMPRRIEGEAGRPFAVDILVAGIDSLTSIQLQLNFDPDSLEIIKTEPSEELVAAVPDGLIFTARWELDAQYYRITVATGDSYDLIVDAAGNRRLCTVYLNSPIDTTQGALDSLEISLSDSVISAVKPGAASPVIITDQVYTDEATIHLGLLQNRIITFDDPDVEAAVRNKIEHGPGDIMLFDVLWLADLSLDEVAAEDLGGLENLASLEILWISYCHATDLSPVSGLVRLTHLLAQGDSLTDISPLAGLTNLQTLDLSYNQISDIYPLVSNPGLGTGDTLYIMGNAGVTGDDTQLGYIATLRNRGVTVYEMIGR